MYDLSPAGLTTFLLENNFKITQSKDTLSLDEFLNLSSKNFINSITL
jgi:hypothetical protein